MKFGLSLPLLLATSLAPFVWSQTAAPTPAPAPKPHGPEAVAAQDPNRVVATINGQKITAKQVMDMLKAFAPEQRKQIDANLSTAVQQIYMQQQLADEAEKLNLEEAVALEGTARTEPAWCVGPRLRGASFGGSSRRKTPKSTTTTHKVEYENVKLSGIFVGYNAPGTPANGAANSRTEEQAHEKANEIEKKLAAGGDFAALARSDSEHQTASKGGDLGVVPINDPQVTIPAEIKTAVAKLQPGHVSEPIHIPNAYLIVKLDSRETTSFEKAKPGIEQKMQNERSQNVVKKETEKYTIHVDDADFFNTGASSTSKIPSLQRPPAK